MDASYTHGHTYRPNIIPITIKIDNSPSPITMMVIKILPKTWSTKQFSRLDVDCLYYKAILPRVDGTIWPSKKVIVGLDLDFGQV